MDRPLGDRCTAQIFTRLTKSAVRVAALNSPLWMASSLEYEGLPLEVFVAGNWCIPERKKR